jgi:hypothetical protein
MIVEKWHEKEAKSSLTSWSVEGRPLDERFWYIGMGSIPYLFRPQMAKVEHVALQ